MLGKKKRGKLGVQICQMTWELLFMLSDKCMHSQSGPVVWAGRSWAHATLLLLVTILSTTVLFWVRICPAQLIFYTTQGKLRAQPFCNK